MTTSTEPRNGLGLATLILGLIGVLFGLVPLTGFIAVGAGLTGVVLAFAGIGRIRRGTANNTKTTGFGMAACLAAIALGIWGMTIVFGAVDELDRELDEIEQDLEEIEAP